MATQTDAAATGGLSAYAWLTGLVAGVLAAVVTGLVIQFGFDPAILSEGIPAAVGASGLAAGWLVFLGIGAVLGLVYAGIARIDRVGAYAAVPDTGAPVGLAYGLVVWAVAVVLVPMGLGTGVGEVGEYAVTARGILAFALLGIVIGLVYGVSPYTE